MNKLQKITCLLLLASCTIVGCNNQTDTHPQDLQNETSSESELSTEAIVPDEIISETETTTETQSVIDTESVAETPIPSTPTEPSQPQFTYADLDKTMYVRSNVNVRNLPNTSGTKLGSLSKGTSVHVTGQCNETNWYRITYNEQTGYVSNKYLSDTKPAEQPAQSKEDEYPDHYIFPDRTPATQEEINAYTFQEMNVVMYPSNRLSYWRLPCNDMEFYCNNENMLGWTWKYVPTKVTGICNETGMYRLEVDGVTVFVSGNKGSFGEDPFLTSVPVATKSNPGYKAGTPEWHAYWDGTTMGEYYVCTGEDLWMTVRRDGALVYSGSYPNDYVIGSYADIPVNGFSYKGEY